MDAIVPTHRGVFGLLLLAALTCLASQTLLSQTADDFNPNPDGGIYSFAVQPDGKILICGGFMRVGGQNSRYVARLNPDGSLDAGFNPNVNSSANSLAIQTDGKILIGGTFTSVGGQTRNNIARLNADGTLDSGFNPNANGSVYDIVIQADGRIIVAGNFTTVGGQARKAIARLNEGGTLEGGFNPDPAGVFSPSIGAIAVDGQGKIVVGGSFIQMAGINCTNIARLNTNGTFDVSFNPGVNGTVVCLAMQVDGKILVGGGFSVIGGQARTNIARLNLDGSLDGGFDPSANSTVSSFAIQTDGGILVSGFFTSTGGQLRNRIVRMDTNGVVDAGFDPDASYDVNVVAVAPDGRILLGGTFATIAGQPRNNLARLNSTGPAPQSFSYNGATISWQRGGVGPEFSRTSFDSSADGIQWSPLGDGVRVPGGWQRTGAILPLASSIRARGFISGDADGAGWFVEYYYGMPVVIANPTDQTNNAGITTTLSASIAGSPPMSFQWFKDGVLLPNSGDLTPPSSMISAHIPVELILTNVLGGDAGGYSLVVSNSFGSATSSVATLTVIDPVINVQPTSQNRTPGQSVTFSVTSVGSLPLSYQWWKADAPLTDATNASVTLSNIQISSAGYYHVVVTNTYGSVTSKVAILSVNTVATDTNFNATVNGWVSPVVVQTDGKIILGGGFTTVGGQSRGRVARVSTNGVLDTTLLNPNANDDVYALALQPDGKLLVGGEFTSLGGQTRYAIGRLNTNGALDTTFTATVFNPFPTPPSPSFRVQAMLIQPDGKIVVGGRSTRTLLGGQTITGGFLYRLNTNGALDNTFSIGGSIDPIISLAQQPDGKILLGGYFSSVGGQTRNRIARINTNGALDTVFNPGLAAPSGINPSPLAMVVQPDGKIIVGGAFNTIAGQSQTNLARLNEDGTLDGSFSPFPSGAANPDVWSVALQTDGQILVSGYFLTMNGAPRSRLARLNADGTLDAAFNPGANAEVLGLALQSDGRILATGFFSQLGGVSRSYIGRLHNTAVASHVLSYNANNLDWQRGGTSPEVWRTTFESSTNGTNWIMLGAGTRNPSGWQLSGATLPPGGTIRSRGYTAGGGYDAASWFVEDRLLIAPNIFANNGSFGFQSNRFSFNLNAPPGAAVIVEASTNLVHWSPILTNLMGSVGDFLFQDLNSVLHPRRYYRAKFYFGSLPKPSFRSSTSGFQGGQFSFNLDGISGQTLTIEASTNLVDWSPLMTNMLGIEPFLFSDATSSNSPIRFYRARLP